MWKAARAFDKNKRENTPLTVPPLTLYLRCVFPLVSRFSSSPSSRTVDAARFQLFHTFAVSLLHYVLLGHSSRRCATEVYPPLFPCVFLSLPPFSSSCVYRCSSCVRLLCFKGVRGSFFFFNLQVASRSLTEAHSFHAHPHRHTATRLTAEQRSSRAFRRSVFGPLLPQR